MRYAVVEKNKVTNVIEANEFFTIPGKTLIQSDTVRPGDIYNPVSGEFTTPIQEVIVSTEEIDRERDRRIETGFEFNGKIYQSRLEDRENIMGASTAALGAIVAGAQIGNLRWHGGDSDFVWIAADNSLTTMDAQTMLAFGQAAMANKQAHIFAARELKDANPIPEDYTDDGWWP